MAIIRISLHSANFYTDKKSKGRHQFQKSPLRWRISGSWAVAHQTTRNYANISNIMEWVAFEREGSLPPLLGPPAPAPAPAVEPRPCPCWKAPFPPLGAKPDVPAKKKQKQSTLALCMRPVGLPGVVPAKVPIKKSPELQCLLQTLQKSHHQLMVSLTTHQKRHHHLMVSYKLIFLRASPN